MTLRIVSRQFSYTFDQDDISQEYFLSRWCGKRRSRRQIAYDMARKANAFWSGHLTEPVSRWHHRIGVRTVASASQPEISDRFQEEIENRDLIAFLMGGLNPRQRDLIIRRFWKGERLRTIGDRFGIGEAAISLAISRALDKMRSKANE